MDIKELENKLKESVENYNVSTMSLEEDQAVYEDFINNLLTDRENEYKGGSLPPLSEILESLSLAINPIDLASALYNYITSISALSAEGEPIAFSKEYNWKDDEIITKELLQKIEDKLRASLTKADALSWGFLLGISKCLGIIQASDSIPFRIGASNYTLSSVYHDLGQLKTYYSDDYELCPKNEPYVFITNESMGIVEPRGLFSIYTLPDSSGTAEDMSFSPKYYNASGAVDNPAPSSFNFDGLELFLEVLTRSTGPDTFFKKFACDLAYSDETGIYSGSGEVLSTCNYTCSFDPKTLKCKISFSSSDLDFRGYEVFGVDIMPKNKSYIPSPQYDGFILPGSNKKHFIWGPPRSSELICENTYKVIE